MWALLSLSYCIECDGWGRGRGQKILVSLPLEPGKKKEDLIPSVLRDSMFTSFVLATVTSVHLSR